VDEAETLANLRGLAFDEAEARFLSMVLLSGGAFLRRQFELAIHVDRSRRTSRFIGRLLDQAAAIPYTLAHNTELFRIRSKRLYTAVGEPDSPFRCRRNLDAILAGLMALDFVLLHPESASVSTRDAAIRHYFGSVMRWIGRDVFLDRFPIVTAAKPTLCYVDSTPEDADRFHRFLHRHRRVMEALGTFDLLFVTPLKSDFRAAESTMNDFLAKCRDGRLTREETVRLLAHFEDRRLYEAREIREFSRARL
jgi:hypothetical protein